MSGAHVRAIRERLGWTQVTASRRWRMSQTYLSMVENDRRRVPARLAKALVRHEPRLATGLPVEAHAVSREALPHLLGALGYPGFAYLADPHVVANPATVLLAALRQPVSGRVTEALPWLLLTFADLDQEWLLNQAKLSNVQNRLGYLVGLARELALERGRSDDAARFRETELELEEARLAKEDTLGRTMTDAERRYLRARRPDAAVHWNLLTSLRAEDLRYAV